MSCVNRNTEEFKELVNSTGIHPDNIESIVYTLQSRNTDPNYYPTASEVREALKPKPIILDESTSKWFLNKGYAGLLIFKNYNDVVKKLDELSEYFSQEQIITYKKTNGDYVVEIGGVKLDQFKYSIGKHTISEILRGEPTTNPYRNILESLTNALGIDNINVSTILSKDAPIKVVQNKNPAFYDTASNTVYYVLDYLPSTGNSKLDNRWLVTSLVHELTHQLSWNALHNAKYPEQIAFREKITDLYNEAKNYINEGIYGIKNVDEFLSEALSNYKFQIALSKIKSNKGQLSLWDKLSDIINNLFSKFFNIDINNTLLKDVLSTTGDFINYTFQERLQNQVAQEDVEEVLPYESTLLKEFIDKTSDRRSNINFYPLKDKNTYRLHIPYNMSLNDALTYAPKYLEKELGSEKAALLTLGKEIKTSVDGKYKYLTLNIKGRGRQKKIEKTKVEKTQKELEEERVYNEKLAQIYEVAPHLKYKVEAGLIDGWELINNEDSITQYGAESVTESNITLEKTEDIELQNEASTNQDKAFVDKSTEVTQQIDNLNSSSLLTASEVRHVARQIVWSISDHITDLMEKPGLAEQIYGERLKDKNLSKMSRAEVAKLIGADNLIARAKELFHPEKANYESFDTMDKAEEIFNNWQAIMLLASSEFLNTEKFSITSIDNNVYEVNEDLNADADNINTSQKDMDILESEGNLQEHWQIETKTLDVLDTMSQKVRQALMGCYILDKEGNPVTSEFGIKERIDVREATNSILRWGQGALSLSQLISKLKEKEKNQPWVKQIIERLSDNSGRESDLKSLFWGTFCKHFQPYSIVTIDKGTGKYKSMIVNENPALKEAIDQVITEYNIGEHPLFTSDGINSKSFENLKEAFQELWKFNTKDTDFSSKDTIKEISNTLGYISNLFGYYVTPQMVENIIDENTFKKMYSALNYIMKSLEQNLNNKTYDPFKFGTKEGVKGNIMQFLKPITDQLEDTSVAAFYDSGKMYQSYITPSYTTKLFKKFGLEGKEFDDFITKEYGNFDWFHTGTNIERGWRNVWLQTLVLNENARKVFKHKVQLNFNKSNYMKTMDDVEYTISLITEYLSGETINGRTTAWFRVPMLSNKPSSEFIRFYSERGDNYKKVLTDGFKKIFDQELSRIQTVEMRNLGKKDPGFIKNFDTNGRKFCFLDFMNEYLNGSKRSSELGQLIRQKLNGESINEARLNELALEAIENSIQSKVNNIISNWEKQGIINGLKKVQGIGATKEEIRNTLENFIWNDTFAAMNIMQLTITDIAYYKDAEDLQKRLAQIHAPGIRGDIYATDYEGNRVSDGFYRTIKLKDFDDFKSNIIDNVSIVFDRKIEAAKTEEEKKGLKALKESLVGEEGAFRKINVADAQGYSSPTSYRKKAFMFGKWSKEAEEVYKKLREGTYNYRDLQVAFQPLKPFVYSQIVKSSNTEKAPLSTLKVPIQFKNSEYLLIMADALLQGENTGKPNLLRAIFKTMERSHFNDKDEYKADGIDTIQFESTTKSGLSGAINLNDLVNDPNGEAIALARLNAAVYKENGSYNENTVDIVPMEDYCLQQEIPEHFKEHEQMHGSQLRYIIPSELESSEGITYKTEKGEVSAQEFKQEYERTIAENIEEDLANLENKLALNSLSIRDRNIALSKVLQREILSSPRYGVDLLQACSIDKNGNFRIPLGDPIQSKRVEQLINSIIKNSVNKQEIPGGPVVQVSSFGTSKELNIRFKNKNKKGELLDLRKDYKGTDEEYKSYIKENQGGIVYFEVFAPIYTNNLFTKFADKNGIINIEAIEMLEPDLLKMIGYRI